MMSSTATNSDTLYTTLKTAGSTKTAQSMKSVRFHGPGDIRVDVVDEPVCGKGQVKVCLFLIGDELSCYTILLSRVEVD